MWVKAYTHRMRFLSTVTVLVVTSVALSVSSLNTRCSGSVPARDTDAEGRDNNAALVRLAREYDAWQDDSRERWMELSSLEMIDLKHSELGQLQESLQAIDLSLLSDDERTLGAVFEFLVAREMGELGFGRYLMPFVFMWGPDLWLGGHGQRTTRWSIEELEAYVNETFGLPTYFQNIQVRMRRGLAEGITPPRGTLRELPDRIGALLAPGGLDHLVQPFTRVDGSERTARYLTLLVSFNRDGIGPLRSELESLLVFVRDEYLPGCRATIGISGLPRGGEYYQHLLHVQADTIRTPQELHDLGRSEVQRLEAEAIEILDSLRLTADEPDVDTAQSFRRRIEELASNPAYRYDDADTLLRSARDVAKQVDGWLPEYFSDLPCLPFAVTPTPPDLGDKNAVGYLLGNLEEGFASLLTFNTTDLSRHTTWNVAPHVLHEGMPGHHLQYALANEMQMAFNFRRTAWCAGFGEGWAMYAEWLGTEMGLYRKPIDAFGRTASELHRACRLVIDPALHALGWSREQAIEFMRDHSALSDAGIVAEVDRMLSHPGQACAYTVNGLRLRALRSQAEEELGLRFDVRAFHDAVIGAGTVPMSVVDRRVNNWIDAVRNAG